MTIRLISLVALLTASCATATLDPTRPIVKHQTFWSEYPEQDGHELSPSDTRKQLYNIEVSRSAAQRSMIEGFVSNVLLVGGLGFAVAGMATDRSGMTYAGAGSMALSFIPAYMSNSDFWRSVDLYNTRFQPGPSTSLPTFVPYVVPEKTGGVLGIAGRF
jgi:hypothetical protein